MLTTRARYIPRVGPELAIQVNVAQTMTDTEVLARLEELRREQRGILAAFPDGHEPIDDGTPVWAARDPG